MRVSLLEVRARALRSLIPPPRLRLSEWIEREVQLPATSALPGPMKLWPYQHAIADALTDPAVEKVTIVKATRIGFTALLVGAVGAYVSNEPAPILCLLPTKSDARDFAVSDLEPVFAASPVLRKALAPDRGDADRDTLTSKRFNGGSLKIIAAKAPRNLRRHTVRVLLVDEADAMEVGAEGNPIRLAERRTLSFSNRKIVIGSTPLLTDTSHVLRSYAESDARVFEVPCLECGTFTEIQWGHIEWPEGEPQQAAFRCPACKALVEERRKSEMVNAGQWRATKPEVQGHAGFRLNALVSLLANASWGKLAAEFLTAKDNPEELQTFVNTILAQGWSSPSLIDESALAGRAEAFDLNAIPPEVLVVTAGVDVHDDRLEATICGWARANECLVLAHVTIWGSYQDHSTWDELDELLRSRWKHPYSAAGCRSTPA